MTLVEVVVAITVLSITGLGLLSMAMASARFTSAAIYRASVTAIMQGYIEQAGAIKGERSAVRDEARIEDVVQKVLAQADKAGLVRSIAEPLWRLLIEKSIEHEFTVFDAKNRKAANG